MKHRAVDEWSYVEVAPEHYPFLVLFPQYDLPEKISGIASERRDSATASFWIRGGNFKGEVNAYLEFVCQMLRVSAVMPEAKFHTPEFFLLLAKIAHAYAIAELGSLAFRPFLSDVIVKSDTSESAQYIGGLPKAEAVSPHLHEIAFCPEACVNPRIVAVRIRLLSCLEAPTYFVAVGERASSR